MLLDVSVVQCLTVFSGYSSGAAGTASYLLTVSSHRHSQPCSCSGMVIGGARASKASTSCALGLMNRHKSEALWASTVTLLVHRFGRRFRWAIRIRNDLFHDVSGTHTLQAPFIRGSESVPQGTCLTHFPRSSRIFPEWWLNAVSSLLLRCVHFHSLYPNNYLFNVFHPS